MSLSAISGSSTVRRDGHETQLVMVSLLCCLDLKQRDDPTHARKDDFVDVALTVWSYLRTPVLVKYMFLELPYRLTECKGV